ncbi:MAG: hypothetical protein ABJA62_10480 [Luteimonas sp.]
MSKPRTDGFKTVVAAVNDVLYNDWDPIGFAGALPLDEYQSYATRVVSMLASGADRDELATYLAHTSLGVTGTVTPVASVMHVAERLLDFREAARALHNAAL